jgi:hypothetical protein
MYIEEEWYRGFAFHLTKERGNFLKHLTKQNPEVVTHKKD